MKDYEEVWANSNSLVTGSGDCEGKACLLASLLKFHTDEVEPDDKVYVKCGFVMVGPEEFCATCLGLLV